MSPESQEVTTARTILETAAAAARPGSVHLPKGALLNMELSALAFNERVVELASDERVPLLERVRFVAILGSNLDEFFRTRVAGFQHQLALGSDKTTLDGMVPEEQLRVIDARARKLLGNVYDNVLPGLLEELRRNGIVLLRWEELDPSEVEYLERNYATEMGAVTTPVAVVPGTPFPHVRNLRPALVGVVGANAGEESYRLIELPDDVPRLVPLPGGKRLIPLEEILRVNMSRLTEQEVTAAYLFRVTRSGNLSLDADDGDETNDLVGKVAENLAKRPFQPVVRLEVEAGMPDSLRDKLLHEFQEEARRQSSSLGEEDVHTITGLIDLNGLSEVAGLPMRELKYPKLPRTSPLRKEPSIFAQIRKRDILVQFPLHSFEKTVERFIAEATDDDDVEAISVTLYRTNKASRIVKLLRRAHRQGKTVVALIEVKASFDERRNIEWARALEAAGIKVLYGPASLKVHAKIASVVRKEGRTRCLYSYVGTGNLNAATAAAYTDLGIFTSEAVLGREMAQLFGIMGGTETKPDFERLVAAPFNMRSCFLELIDREIEHASSGVGGRMTVKVNGIADKEIIEALYRASQAGVRVDLSVRGICALRPGVPGLSENIRVVAIAGRYLEHARIYRFDNGGSPVHYIGSADWRGRNLSRRVEVVASVRSKSVCKTLDQLLERDFLSADAWDMLPDGSYLRRTEAPAVAKGARIAARK